MSLNTGGGEIISELICCGEFLVYISATRGLLAAISIKEQVYLNGSCPELSSFSNFDPIYTTKLGISKHPEEPAIVQSLYNFGS